MSAIATLSHRPLQRFWGWGNADEELTQAEEAMLLQRATLLSPQGFKPTPPPAIDEFTFAESDVRVPDSLAKIISTTPYDRLTHAYGKSWADGARMCLRQLPSQALFVAFPRDEQQISDVFDWAGREGLAVVPFGGGSSVCGGVEAKGHEHNKGVVSLDLQYFNRVLEIDGVSRAARIQGGIFGPELEDALRGHDLTLRHFPQSFQFSTLGGWIATRSGGHYATVYTHIDEFVESLRMVTPAGVIETRRLPGSGAGPDPNRLLIGSEGCFGVITEAWMRLQNRPKFRASASIEFPDLRSACNAVRAISQSALFPANCRLLDAAEAFGNGIGTSPMLVLGFESADHELDAWISRALELCADHGGTPKKKSGESDASADWKSAFLRMPYFRNYLTPLGLIADTFETAITWDRFDEFYAGVKEKVGKAIEESCGHPALVSCRFTHVYPDGPAPYFTFYAVGTNNGDMASALSRWHNIKAAANEAVVSLGGTCTHHHAVGRDHRSAYEAETSPLIRDALCDVKKRLDPKGVLNPGGAVKLAGR